VRRDERSDAGVSERQVPAVGGQSTDSTVI